MNKDLKQKKGTVKDKKPILSDDDKLDLLLSITYQKKNPKRTKFG